ncbi:MAG: ferredoxin [Kiritimatiellia bacterium]
MPIVTFVPGVELDVPEGTTLLDASELTASPLECQCGGVAACNSCRVFVIEGAENLSPMLPEEHSFVDDDGQRLGCQAMVFGPVVVRAEPGM